MVAYSKHLQLNIPLGYCGKLLRYGLKEIVKDAPVYLEATTPRSRNLYSHLGFEVGNIFLTTES